LRPRLQTAFFAVAFLALLGLAGCAGGGGEMQADSKRAFNQAVKPLDRQAAAQPDWSERQLMESAYIHPREVELKLTYSLLGITPQTTDTVTMYEFSEEPVSWKAQRPVEKPALYLYVARQRDYANQRGVETLEVTPPPDEIVSRDIDGNIIEFWDLSKAAARGGDIVITRHIRFTAWETAFALDPDAAAGEYDREDPTYKYYTRTQEFLEQTPEVRALARRIVGAETNPLRQARAIYTWCMENIDYVYPPDRGIRCSLPRRTGDCGEYSLIFAALCRSVGIPARVVNGHWCCKAKKNYHVWNEFFLPGYGWIPADATDGRINRDSPGKLAGGGDPMYYFGHLDSGRFISSKGTSIALYPPPPWHEWGLADKNNAPIFFQTAATVSAGLTIETQKATMEIIKGDDVIW